MKKKLWIVSELFYPEETSTAYILTEIANKLSEKYEVEAICGPAVYDQSKKATTAQKCKASINRIEYKALNKNRLYGKLYNFTYLSLRIFFKLLLAVKKGDKVLIVTNPVPLIILAGIARKLKQFHLNILVHDVFPENTIPAGVLKNEDSFYFRFLRFIFNKGYASADKLIVLGRDMHNVFSKKVGGSTDIVIIENWADITNIKPVRRSANTSITFQYAGNLGRVQGLIPLLEAINISSNPNLKFDFYGAGALVENMEDYIKFHNLSNVKIHGPYSRNQQQEILNLCDIAIITLADKMYGLGVPSKAYNILASGKPILFIGDIQSEVALMIKENHIGFVFDPSDRSGIECFFKSIHTQSLKEFQEMGIRARELAEIKYSKEIILNKFATAL